jgi:hypothetical protein
MEFTRDDVIRQFDPGTFARGEHYASKGMVTEIELDCDRIYGDVQGSGHHRYQQTIRIKRDKSGIRISGDCSCPMTHNCKHVVAVLLTELARGALDVPAAAERWLQQLAGVQDYLRQAEGPLNASMGLVYVLVPERHRGLGLLPFTAHFKQDGRIAAAILETDPLHLLARRPPHVRRDDEEPLRLLGAMCAGQRSAEPAGVLGAQLLGKLAGEGRLWRARTLNEAKHGYLHPVAPGPRRHMDLVWLEDGIDREVATLGWRVDGDDLLEHTFTTDPLFYLDGPVEQVVGRMEAAGQQFVDGDVDFAFPQAERYDQPWATVRVVRCLPVRRDRIPSLTCLVDGGQVFFSGCQEEL